MKKTKKYFSYIRWAVSTCYSTLHMIQISSLSELYQLWSGC